MVNLKHLRNFRAVVKSICSNDWPEELDEGFYEGEKQVYRDYGNRKGRQLRTEENFQVKILQMGHFQMLRKSGVSLC